MCRQQVPSRLSGRRACQNRSSSSCSYRRQASQHAPHCRGRCNGIASRRTWTPYPLACSGTSRLAGNNASGVRRCVSSSNASMTRHQRSCWLSLISPRYHTWRCTTLPSAQRLASTMFQSPCSLPSLTRRLHRRYMMPPHDRQTSAFEKTRGLHDSDIETRSRVSTRLPETSTAKNRRFLRRVEKVGLGGASPPLTRPLEGKGTPTA